jgi:indole-3-acetate monooxygenase
MLPMHDSTYGTLARPETTADFRSEHAAETAAGIATRIRALAPEVMKRAGEFEAARRIPLDLIERLKSIGIFRMFAPRSFGGLELDLPIGLDIITMLSRLDGSLGWTAMIGSGSSLVLPSLPREKLARVYRFGPDVIAGGAAQPAGTAEAVDGGFRVSGRWPFASGCQHADWLFALCVMTRNGKPLPGPLGEAGPPLIRAIALPACDWQIEDTWFAAGLKGTGSHHIVLENKLVPSDHIFDFPNGTTCEAGPLYQAVAPLLPMFHGAFSVGVARGALDDVIAMARTGRRQQRTTGPMRDSETFQFELGRAAADVIAAEATLRTEVSKLWSHALAGTLKGEALLAESISVGAWLATNCSRAADLCFTLGGGSAVYENSPLQRRMRDLHTGALHATVHQRHFAQAGRMLLADPASDAGRV